MEAELLIGFGSWFGLDYRKSAPVFKLALPDAILLIGLSVISRSLCPLESACQLFVARLVALVHHLARALQARSLIHLTFSIDSGVSFTENVSRPRFRHVNNWQLDI